MSSRSLRGYPVVYVSSDTELTWHQAGEAKLERSESSSGIPVEKGFNVFWMNTMEQFIRCSYIPQEVNHLQLTIRHNNDAKNEQLLIYPVKQQLWLKLPPYWPIRCPAGLAHSSAPPWKGFTGSFHSGYLIWLKKRGRTCPAFCLKRPVEFQQLQPVGSSSTIGITTTRISTFIVRGELNLQSFLLLLLN